jgi:dipeptidyl aminopeptidase/acylaminoacyl peptidase
VDAGGDQVAVLDPAASPPTLTVVPLPPASSIGDLSVSSGPGGVGTLVVTVGASSTTPSEIRGAMLPDAVGQSEWDWKAYRKSTDLAIDGGYLSFPQEMEFPTENHGIKRTAHLIYYAPTNKDYTPVAGELPPLLVKSHGGPTGAASSAFSLAIQFWTSRGVAVADVNYGGSTGFGKEYRQRLTKPQPNWGVVDASSQAVYRCLWVVAPF